MPAAQKDVCEAEKKEALEEKFAACEPEEPSLMDEFNRLQLDAHNAYRQLHNTEPLTYNHDIAVAAQEYAQWMKDNDKFEHSAREDRDFLGENLYWSTFQGMAERSDASDDWYAEVEYYNYDSPGDSTGVVGHFTQMIWKASLEIGCGIADEFVVCRYSPAGNVGDWDGGYSQYLINVTP